MIKVRKNQKIHTATRKNQPAIAALPRYLFQKDQTKQKERQATHLVAALQGQPVLHPEGLLLLPPLADLVLHFGKVERPGKRRHF